MYYVYIYRDPKTFLPFYVGKGKKDRCFIHLSETKENTSNYLKWCKIQSILNANLFPIVEISFFNENENICYDFEQEIIAFYGKLSDNSGILTNICDDNRPPNNKGKLHFKSDSYRLSISLAKRGSKNPQFGKSPWNKGIPTTNEIKLKISLANRGRKYSKIEHEKRNKTRGKTYKIISPAGDIEVVKNLKQWCRNNKLEYGNMRQALTGYKGKTKFKGYSGILVE